MSAADLSEYVVDLTNHSNRLRLESISPGRPVKVMLRHARDAAAASIHGSGVLSDDGSTLTIDFPSDPALHRLTLDWRALSRELAGFSETD
jgi:hypothetical protein